MLALIGWIRIASEHRWKMKLIRPDFLRDDLERRLGMIAADKQSVLGEVVSALVLVDGETPTKGGQLKRQRPR